MIIFQYSCKTEKLTHMDSFHLFHCHNTTTAPMVEPPICPGAFPLDMEQQDESSLRASSNDTKNEVLQASFPLSGSQP